MSEAPEIAGWKHVYSGKVRDLYAPTRGSDDRLLVVASDRVSAFDHVLEPGIPGKGALLTSLSSWWFAQLAGGDGGDPVPNHLTGEDPPEAVADRATVVTTLDMLPVECVVRGYITGSGWREYREAGTVCGIRLPEGLQNGDRLPQPIYTPAYKAPLGEHDENISYERTVELVGAERAAELRDVSLDIYRRADRIAAEKGLIVADTKFEFGVDDAGTLRLGDEVLTSDSSRYWDRAAWQNGSTPEERMASFDKQIVRDWLAANWTNAEGRCREGSAGDGPSAPEADDSDTPPRLPADIVTRTLDRYRDLLTRLTA
ncbi:phosphoribosylaminoimidazole-succinocarboxamide synthase [Microbacterium faecale]|uniref:Phosphoribosylaminoimidazole-succinocarboxamide synthase n=1 Tax=Microbacterium faecale TaxID=1804630 RepID=A0A916Y0G1_9MICO|nr:phosphoribosylaminoimidazolesuccinocarboxamide synthase [Microbacterium faecale]GGD24891.1 phosphoribosylaminoimidazole-succinocarboxamide synthase [Microbacterium faecale]